MPFFLSAADNLTEDTMVNALEGLPEETAVNRARDSAASVDTFARILGDNLPQDLEDDVSVIRDAVAAFDEHLQDGGKPADVDDL